VFGNVVKHNLLYHVYIKQGFHLKAQEETSSREVLLNANLDVKRITLSSGSSTPSVWPCIKHLHEQTINKQETYSKRAGKKTSNKIVYYR